MGEHSELNIDVAQGSLEAQALAFEASHSHSKRKRQGIFYTPLPVVDHIIQSSLVPRLRGLSSEEITALKVLDPACGSGIFLLRAFRAILEELTSRGAAAAKIAHQVAADCLYGIDIDEGSAQKTKELINQAVVEAGWRGRSLTLHIAQGNGLIDRPLRVDVPSFDWQTQFPLAVAQGGFDLILGNPPYGLSRDQQLSPAENSCLQTLYAPFRDGKINKFLAFMAMGYLRLREGGQLSFVVPNSWLGIRSAVSLRKRWLLDGSLAEVHTFENPIFNDPSLEPVVFRVHKGAGLSSIRVRRFSRPGRPQLSESCVPVSFCLSDSQHKIPLLWSAEGARLLQQIRQASVPLQQSAYLPSIALQAYATGKGIPAQSREDVQNQIYHSSRQRGENSFPYLEGGDINRFELRWSGRYLAYGRFLAEPQKIERFSGPRVLLREILGSAPNLIRAAYCETTCLYNKSVLHVIAREPTVAPSEMKALAALLNSRPIAFVLLLTGRKSQRKLFPKLLNDDLRELPLPNAFASHVPELALLYDCRSNAATKEQREPLEFAIDELIGRLFGLSNADLEALNRIVCGS